MRRDLRWAGACILAMAVCVAAGAQAPAKSCAEGKMRILRQTPILVVDKIEPNLEFYEKRLGYQRLAEVPHGGALGFVMLEQNSNHLMMQTRASIADDLGASAADATSRDKLLDSMKGRMVAQFVIVDSIEAAMECVRGLKLLVPLRTTNYGMKEIVVQDTAGFPIVFAQEVAEAKKE